MLRYVIDELAVQVSGDIRIQKPEDELEEVDVIIVSSIFAFEEIAENLKEVIVCPVISLEEMI